MSHFHWDGRDLILHCHLQPKASANAFAGLHGDRIKIRLTAPPVDGKANALLHACLTTALAVSTPAWKPASRAGKSACASTPQKPYPPNAH